MGEIQGKKCELDESSGSIALMDSANCEKDLTIKRIKFLKSYK